VKVYGEGEDAYRRLIRKPVFATLRVAVGGAEIPAGAFAFDDATGEIVFAAGSIPGNGLAVSCGYDFDVPVRFDTDRLEIGLKAFKAGQIPSIPLIVRGAPTPWRPSIPASLPTVPAVVGQPHAVFLDLPSGIGEGAPQDQFRVALRQKPWRSQALFVSPEETGFVFRTTVGRPANLGRLASAVQPGVVGRVDKAGVLLVELFDAEAASVSLSQLLNGANAAAMRSTSGNWEIVQFATAEEIAPQLWRLTDLLRGQLGTDDAMAAGAPAGADFVLLDDAVAPAGLQESEMGLLLNWRVGPSGADLSSANFTTQAQIGGLRVLLPLSPVHLRAERAGGDIRFSWIRRGRIDADKWDGSDIPLGEEREEYRIDIARPGGAVLRTAVVAEPSWLYPAAAAGDDFGALPAEIEVSVRQFSVAAGWGIPAVRRIVLG
jgi:hypothetical protein